MSGKATSTNMPPWSALSKKRLEELDLMAFAQIQVLDTAEMYYYAERIVRYADDIENGENKC